MLSSNQAQENKLESNQSSKEEEVKEIEAVFKFLDAEEKETKDEKQLTTVNSANAEATTKAQQRQL